ncbi:MAG: hypothetical protein WD275_05475, partial [Rhodothermales bacterium]
VVEPHATTMPATTEQRKYVPLLNVRPRIAYPFFVYQRSTGDEKDTSLGFGAGAGIEWSDPLQYWTAQTAAYYQKDVLWGRFFLKSGRTLLQPGLELFRTPSTVVVRLRTGEQIDTVRVGRDERGIAVGVQLPAVLRSNVFQSSAQVSLAAQYRQERLFDDEGETIRAWEERLSINPAATLVLGSQSNARDIVPNSGLIVSAVSEVALWSDRDNPSNWLQARSTVFLPFLRRSNTGVALHATWLAQNRGGIIDLTNFFPRGYETRADFLGRGVFAKYGAEITQPLWYIDNGFFLFPLYFKALFAYGFAETLLQVSGPRATERLTVAGAGLGLQMRLVHSISLTIRFAPVYDFVSDEWEVTFR